jgi:hypothetical protein
MANSEALAGVHSWVLYGAESTFNTAVAVTTHFGLKTNFKGTINNNLVAQRGFVGTSTGGRSAYSFTPGKLEIGWTSEFKATRWHFMQYVLGSVSGAGPYTYAEAAVPGSLTIAENIDNPGSAATDMEATYSGCVIDTCTIKCAVGEEVKVTLEGKAAKVVIDTTITSAVALPSEDVFTFTGGSIELPSGAALGNIIDSVEITIKNNWEMMYGLGSRLAVNALPHERDYTIKLMLKYKDNTLITAALGATTPTAAGGPTEYATLIMTFASGTRSLTMTFSGVPMSDFAQVAELNSPIGHDITLVAETLSCSDDRT